MSRNFAIGQVQDDMLAWINHDVWNVHKVIISCLILRIEQRNISGKRSSLFSTSAVKKIFCFCRHYMVRQIFLPLIYIHIPSKCDIKNRPSLKPTTSPLHTLLVRKQLTTTKTHFGRFPRTFCFRRTSRSHSFLWCAPRRLKKSRSSELTRFPTNRRLKMI